MATFGSAHHHESRHARGGLARRALGPRGRSEIAVAALTRRVHDVADEWGFEGDERDLLTDAVGVLATWLVIRGEAGSLLDTNVHADEEDVYVRASIRSSLTEIVLPEQIARLAPMLQPGTDSFHIDLDESRIVAVLQRSIPAATSRG